MLTAIRTSDAFKEKPAEDVREQGQTSEEEDRTPEERQPPQKKGRRVPVVDDDELDALIMDSRDAMKGKERF